MANKNPTSFRLAADALAAIRELAAIQGGSQSEAVEFLAREWKRKNLSEATAARLEEMEARLRQVEEKLGE